MQWLNRFGMLLLLSLPATSLAYPHYGLYQPHRTLMYFTPSEGEESAAFQQQMLIHGCQMDERDLRCLC
ncbi:hypothetical protein [Enterovibrio coralii]|uniref:hypothetical protein n=1 Tax=Enterovibrio coralii TaxID=294935 RepID=UPI000A561B4D|nr:hypothetical protein [Enterovibrio coralii]